MQAKKSSLIIILAVLLMVPFASASLWDFLTGKATTEVSNINVSITSNSAPVIMLVDTLGTFTPAEATTKNLTINATIYDADGVVDIDLTKINLNVTKLSCGGEARNRGAICVNNSPSDSSAGKYLNITCGITFNYWDCNGPWAVNFTAYDHSSVLAVNDTVVLTVAALNAASMTNVNLTFPSLTVGASNVDSLVNTTINITGNTGPNIITVLAIDLRGETIPSEYFNITQFKATTSNASKYTEPCATGIQLVNGTATEVANEVGGVGAKPRSRTDANAGKAWSNIDYCITSVPTMSKQSYSTAASGAWTVNVAF